MTNDRRVPIRVLSPSGFLDQCLAILLSPEGRPQAWVIRSEQQLAELSRTHKAHLMLGDGHRLPPEHAQAPLQLSSGYAGLFEHLFFFYRSNGHLCEGYTVPRGLLLCIAPHTSAESHGVMGRHWYDKYEVCFYADKASGRQLLQAWHEDMQDGGSKFERFVPADLAEHLPHIEQSSLPETGGGPVVSLEPRAAAWFTWWYCAYHHVTGQIG